LHNLFTLIAKSNYFDQIEIQFLENPIEGCNECNDNNIDRHKIGLIELIIIAKTLFFFSFIKGFLHQLKSARMFFAEAVEVTQTLKLVSSWFVSLCKVLKDIMIFTSNIESIAV